MKNIFYKVFLKYLVLLFTFKPLIHPESISVVSEKQGFL